MARQNTRGFSFFQLFQLFSLQPWGLFSRWEILDQSDWRKHPINTLSRPFLKLSTSSVGLSERLHLKLYLSQQESCFTTSAGPTLSEQPSWTGNICFVVSFFLPIICSDPFLLYWQVWLPALVQETSKSLAGKTSLRWCIVYNTRYCSQCLPAAFCTSVVFLDVFNRGASPWCDSSHRVFRASTSLSSFKEDWRGFKNTLAQLLRQKSNTSWPVTGKPWITVSAVTPSSLIPLSTYYWGTKVRTFQRLKLNNCKTSIWCIFELLLLLLKKLQHVFLLIIGILFYIFLTSHSNPSLRWWLLQCIFCCLVANVIKFHCRKFFSCCVFTEAGAQV